MVAIPFNEWLPDAPQYGIQGVHYIKNAKPHNSRSFNAAGVPVDVMAGTLPARCYGAWAGRTASGNYVLYAGTQTNLYKRTGDTWTSVTRLSGGAYTTATSSRWIFAQFGNSLIAVNGSDTPQIIDLDVGANFRALGGDPPAAATCVGVLSDYVLLGSGNTLYISGRNNPEIWNTLLDPVIQATTGADAQVIPDGGPILAFGGNDIGYVFQEDAVRRIVLINSTVVFQLEKILGNFGPLSSGAVSEYQGQFCIVSKGGIFLLSNNGLKDVSLNKVRDYFLENYDKTQPYKVLTAYDKGSGLWMVSFCDTAINNNFNRVLLYNPVSDSWGICDWAIDAFVTTSSTFVSIDDITGSIDLVTTSLDYPPYIGTDGSFGWIQNNALKVESQSQALDCTIETKWFQIHPTNRTLVQRAWPRFELDSGSFANVSVQLEAASGMGNSAVQTKQTSPYSVVKGQTMVRASGRWHRLTLYIVGDAELVIPPDLWEHAMGFEIDAVPHGAWPQ